MYFYVSPYLYVLYNTIQVCSETSTALALPNARAAAWRRAHLALGGGVIFTVAILRLFHPFSRSDVPSIQPSPFMYHDLHIT